MTGRYCYSKHFSRAHSGPHSYYHFILGNIIHFYQKDFPTIIIFLTIRIWDWFSKLKVIKLFGRLQFFFIMFDKVLWISPSSLLITLMCTRNDWPCDWAECYLGVSVTLTGSCQIVTELRAGGLVRLSQGEKLRTTAGEISTSRSLCWSCSHRVTDSPQTRGLLSTLTDTLTENRRGQHLILSLTLDGNINPIWL